jgi:hypothetical protein
MQQAVGATLPNPFRRVGTFLDILAPGIAQNHITGGATWTSEGGTGLSGPVTYASPTIVDSSNSISSSLRRRRSEFPSQRGAGQPVGVVASLILAR